MKPGRHEILLDISPHVFNKGNRKVVSTSMPVVNIDIMVNEH